MAYRSFTDLGVAASPHADHPHDGEPTPADLQRWEDDGGAALPRTRHQHGKPCYQRERDALLFDAALAELITAG